VVRRAEGSADADRPPRPCPGDVGRRRGDRRRHPSHLPLARGEPYRRRWAVDEPVDGRAARGRRPDPRRRSGHPCRNKQEHLRRRCPGLRARRQAGPRGRHEGSRRALLQLLDYDPEASAAENVELMTRLQQPGSWPARSPVPCGAGPIAGALPSSRATGSACPARASRSSPAPRRRLPAACSTVSSRTPTRS